EDDEELFFGRMPMQRTKRLSRCDAREAIAELFGADEEVDVEPRAFIRLVGVRTIFRTIFLPRQLVRVRFVDVNVRARLEAFPDRAIGFAENRVPVAEEEMLGTKRREPAQ